MLTKLKPVNVSYGLNCKKFDDEGRTIIAEFEKFFLICVYVPNSKPKLIRL